MLNALCNLMADEDDGKRISTRLLGSAKFMRFYFDMMVQFPDRYDKSPILDNLIGCSNLKMLLCLFDEYRFDNLIACAIFRNSDRSNKLAALATLERYFDELAAKDHQGKRGKEFRRVARQMATYRPLMEALDISYESESRGQIEKKCADLMENIFSIDGDIN